MVIQENIAEAKAKLSALIEAAAKGEDVIIARNGEPVARIETLAGRRIRLGVLKDYGWTHDTPYEVFAPEPGDQEVSPLIPGDPST